VTAEEESLRVLIRELPDDQRKRFYALSKEKLKDPDTFAVLNYLFVTGLHHFYLGHWLRGLINLSGFIAAIFLWALGLWPAALLLIVLISVTELYALFRAQVIVQDHNNKLMAALLRQL